MPYLTYFDVVEHLITSSFGGPQDAEQRDIRTAVQRAYQELTTMRDWSYYHVHGRVITDAPYSSGAVTISGTTATHLASCTGSASTDKITAASHGLSNGDTVSFATLSGGGGLSTGVTYYVVSAEANAFKVSATNGGAPIDIESNISSGTFGGWPSWAANGGYLKIGQEIARVSSGQSGASITLDSQVKFKTDFASSPFTLYRTVYPLPADFRNLDEPSDEYNWWAGLYITPDEAMKLERVSNSSGEPYHWTVIKAPSSSGWAIKLIGYPTKRESIDFTYRRTARPLRYSGHEAVARAGTVARAQDPDTSIWAVTGSGTSFAASMVGAIMRFGDSSSVPGPLTSITPYSSESKITAVASGTSLTTEDIGTLAASTKYLITDPLDLPEHMHNCMYSAAEYWLARVRNQKVDSAFSMYQRDMRLAMEQDQLAPLSGRSQQIWHDGGWKSPLKADQGV